MLSERDILFYLSHADGEAIRDIAAELVPIFNLAKDLRTDRREGMTTADLTDLVINKVYDVQKAIQQNNSIGRKVRRADMNDLLDQAFAPLLSMLATRDTADALLCARDLRHALAGDRNFGYGASPMAMVCEDVNAHRAAIVAFRKRTRAPLQVVTPDDASGHRILILCDPITPKMMRVAFRAEARGSVLCTYGCDLDGLPRFDDLGAAVNWGRVEIENVDIEKGMIDPDAEPAWGPEWGPATDALNCEMLVQENRDLRNAVAQNYDRTAAMIAELDEMLKDTEYHKPLFEIYANGARMHHNPTHAQMLNGMRHKISRLEAETARLRGEVPTP